MAKRIKRKYIDSHWLIFAIEGVVALVFGWMIMFSGSADSTYLVSSAGLMLLIFGMIELFNVLHREHVRNTWAFAMAAAVFEVMTALALLFTINQNSFLHLGLLAAYTFIRGVLELAIAFKTIDDRTDKFIWLICGVCGVIISFVIFNSGLLPEGTFVKFFGSYLVILGLGDLIYGVHNHDQKLEYLEERRAKRQAAKKKTTKKPATSRKKRK